MANRMNNLKNNTPSSLRLAGLRPDATLGNQTCRIENSILASKESNILLKGGVPTPPIDSDLLTQPAWADARVALHQIEKGSASGNEAALRLRVHLQSELFKFGGFIQKHPGKILFVGLLLLGTFCVGLKSVKLETRIEKLWVQAGGRLQKELEYIQSSLGTGAGSISELVIQTPRYDGIMDNILTSEALLTHLDVIKEASSVEIDTDDVTWKLTDLCHAPTIPSSEIPMINQIMTKLFPCAIITPLDCFWEGSKLLGPFHPLHIPLGGEEGSLLLSWTSLNPLKLLRQMDSFDNYFDFQSFEDLMKTAGITTGYQEKPCLNPFDPECPISAPNKNSHQKLDIGAQLSGGCFGFATRFMHWPEELLIGGITRNKSRHIIRAKGLQSIVQIMGEKDLYEYWSDTYKVHAMDWSIDKASSILARWHGKFSQVVNKPSSWHKKFDISAFSSSHFNTLLSKISEITPTKIILGYALMLLYCAIILWRWRDLVRSQAGLGIMGVILVTVTVAAGLGLSAVLGFTFNAASTQILPFLALGIGVDALFLMVHTYEKNISQTCKIPIEHQIGELLRRSGISLILTSTCNVVSFLAAAIIPIPALRTFCLQAAILLSFNAVSMLILFPALISFDLRRVVTAHTDVLCCYPAAELAASKIFIFGSHNAQQPKKVDINHKTNNGVSREKKTQCGWDRFSWSFSWFAAKYYVCWLTLSPVKCIVLIICVVLSGSGIWGLCRLKDGLDFMEIVPQNSSAYKFLLAQDKYFGFYNMYAITKGNMEYPTSQVLLYDYHNSFVSISNIIKDDDGGLPEFWLSLFRNWLVRLQEAYDRDVANGCFHDLTHAWPSNASGDAILAYKLLVQTGHVDNPVDLTLAEHNRLVDMHGMINPSGFYNYLSAWTSNDAMAYSYSQASFQPVPKTWYSDIRDQDLRIPKSSAIKFARIPFFLNNVGETDVLVETIRSIRSVCERFELKGLPNFPSGIPFTFWEQYLSLRFWMMLALLCVVGVIFIIISATLLNIWIAAVVVITISSVLVQTFGLMAILGIKISAVSAVILVVGVGLVGEFTIQICLGFMTCIGSRHRRILLVLENSMGTVIHGSVSTFLGILILATSQFDFVFRYFFVMLSAVIVLGLFNNLVFLPVLLVIIGPLAEVVPNDPENKLQILPPPNPPRSQVISVSKPKTFNSGNSRLIGAATPKRHNSELSLSTIAEESNTYSNNSSSSADFNQIETGGATSVFVEPHVVVETTTTVPSTRHSCSSGGSSRSSSPIGTCSGVGQVTKVTATAKFKVEVRTPAITGSAKRPKRRNHDTMASTSPSSSEGDLGFPEK